MYEVACTCSGEHHGVVFNLHEDKVDGWEDQRGRDVLRSLQEIVEKSQRRKSWDCLVHDGPVGEVKLVVAIRRAVEVGCARPGMVNVVELH